MTSFSESSEKKNRSSEYALHVSGLSIFFTLIIGREETKHHMDVEFLNRFLLFLKE
jgi:hypothetical protein